GPARHGEPRARDERLDLDQQRPASLERREDGQTGRTDRPLGEERGGRVRHLDETPLAHLEHGHLVRRPEPVLDRSQHAKRVGAVALEVEDRDALPRQRAACLQRESRLPDPGVPADQNDRAGDEPTTEHAIELGDSGRAPERFTRLDRCQWTRPGSGGRDATGTPRAGVGERLFDERVPRITARTLAEPARRRVPALLAYERGAPGLVNHIEAPG